MKRVVLLVATVLLSWLILGSISASLDGAPMALTGIAVGIVLFPAIGTLILMDVLRNHAPQTQLGACLISIFLRMGLTVGGGLIAYYLIPLVRDNRLPFVFWGLGFYLMTLVIETAMVYRQFQNSAPAAGRQNGP